MVERRKADPAAKGSVTCSDFRVFATCWHLMMPWATRQEYVSQFFEFSDTFGDRVALGDRLGKPVAIPAFLRHGGVPLRASPRLEFGVRAKGVPGNAEPQLGV
jgi:hypothetical protein